MIEEYLNLNYKRNLKKYRGMMIHNYSSIPQEDIIDMYHDVSIKLITCKGAIENTITDIDNYFWRMLLNYSSWYYKNKHKKNIDLFTNTDYDDTIFNLEDIIETDKFKEDWLMRLSIRLKLQLTNLEYMIFINYTFNKMNSIQIAKQIGYSKASVYQKTKSIFEKIKKEIEDNEEEYYNI